MIQKTEHYKKVLEKELKELEGELKGIGRINPDNPKDWEALPPEKIEMGAEPEELAEKMETYEENTALLKQLEIRYNEVKDALEKIHNEGFGICKVCGKEIEGDRLEANPAATTCIEHK